MSEILCNKSPDKFCFLCAKYIVSKNSLSLTNHYRDLYEKCYHQKVTENGADKTFASGKICKNCAQNLLDHVKKQKPLKFSTPAKWISPRLMFRSHEESCFVCLTRLTLGAKFEPQIVCYPEFSTNVTPATKSDEERVNHKGPLSSNSSESDLSVNSEQQTDEKTKPVLINQPSLNTLVRMLDLSKESSEILASFLKKSNLLTPDCKVSYYRNRNEEILNFFKEVNGVPYLKNIESYFDWLNIDYKPDEWRLFIDSNISSLKCVLLHNSNKLPSIPLLYSSDLKENYSDIKLVLKLVQYSKNQWRVIADLKLLNILCGIGVHSSKNPCLFCNWIGTFRSKNLDQQYNQPDLKNRDSFEIGIDSVRNQALIDLEKVLLPSLHIKIGIIGQFVKRLFAIYKENGRSHLGYEYLQKLFHRKSEAKLEAGILNGPDIRLLLRNSSEFCELLDPIEKRAFRAFEAVCLGFLGQNRELNYISLCKELGDSFYSMKCNNSPKLHYLQHHIDRFPPNCSDFSDEMGERFHQDIKKFEKRYQGKISINMLSDYCWTLKQEIDLGTKACSRKSLFPSYLSDQL